MPDPIPLRYVIATLDPAGAERLMTGLAVRLDRRRFSPEVICLTRGGPLEADLREAAIPVRILGKRGSLDPAALFRLTGILREKPEALVHTWMFTANAYGRVAALLAACRRLIASEVSVDPWKGPVRLGIDSLLARRTAAIVGNAEAVAAFYRTHLPHAADRILAIRGAHLPRPGTPNALTLPPGRWIGSIGRLVPQKGFDILLKAMPSVLKTFPDVRLAVEGQGPDRQALEALVARLGIQGSCTFLGHLPDPRALFGGIQAFVLASRFEGLPNVLLEAMDAGVPCVATDVGGNRELLDDSRAGRVVPPEDPGALAEAIVAMLQAPLEARRLGALGRERVRTDFAVDAMVEAYAALYERLWRR